MLPKSLILNFFRNFENKGLGSKWPGRIDENEHLDIDFQEESVWRS